MSYIALRTDGNGYAAIADGSQAGLNMGLSGFMIEIRVKLNTPLANQSNFPRIIEKIVASLTGYRAFFDSGGEIWLRVGDGAVRSAGADGSFMDDLAWHTLAFIVDRSSATGLKIYNNGTELSYITQQNVSEITGSFDSSHDFEVGGDASFVGTSLCDASFDEVRIWNFGLNGLPVDYAAYITWRAQGRNVFKDISEYNGGSWSGYADAYRIERITYGDLDDDNGDFENAGVDGTDISTNTDWEKINISGEVDDGAGSGVTTYNGSAFCAKIHTATGDFSSIRLLGVNLDAAFTVGDWYELSYDYKTLDCTYAKLRVMRAAGTIFLTNLTSVVWTTSKIVFQLTVDNDMRIDIFPHYSSTETGNEVVWIDNVSIKRIGLTARYRFNGDLLDETTNSNDLTAGGSGNTFPRYSLRHKGQKMLLGVV